MIQPDWSQGFAGLESARDYVGDAKLDIGWNDADMDGTILLYEEESGVVLQSYSERGELVRKSLLRTVHLPVRAK